MPERPAGLRIVAYCVRPQAYALIAGWCAREGHRLLLVVTSPGPKSRPTPTYREVLAAAPRTQEILITTRMQRPVPLIRELAPDLVVSFTFPYRVPPEVVALPKYGAVNLHPAPLPLYRGPNPLRGVYDGHPLLGATLHWIAPEYDTGNVLAQATCPLPEDRSVENLFGAWLGTMQPAFEQGIARALAGDPGTPQDERKASYGGVFTAEERWLDWSLPAALLQGRASVLAFNTEGMEDHDAPGCLARIGGVPHAVQRVTPLPGVAPPAAPGAVLAGSGDVITLCCGDGVLQVQAAPLAPAEARA
ncbi:MAG TPA: formyltransferase family protein [Dehalococcoidia bacterium]|nr:formyltransferase family protein [Dehalococcoidia bacterium]